MKTISTLILVLLNLSYTYSQSSFIKHSYPRISTHGVKAEFLFLDFNNDGNGDLFYPGSHAFIHPNLNPGFDSLNYVEYPYLDCTIPIDWNNDGLPDLINESGFDLKRKYNIGNFSFSSTTTLATTLNSKKKPTNLNNDSYPDVISFGGNSVTLIINQNGTDTVDLYSIPLNATYSDMYVSSNDVDNDGLYEVFVKIHNDLIYVYEQTGTYDYTVQDTISSPNIGLAKNPFYFYDFDNDGIKELITRDGWFINIFQNTIGNDYSLVYSGDAFYSVTTNILFNQASLTEISDFYDVDNNGYLDIVAGNYVFFNNGNFAFNKVSINSSPKLFSQNFQCFDFDGDGLVDINYAHLASNTLFEEVFLRNECLSGQVINQKEVNWFEWNESSSNRDIIDFDQDGDVDVVSFNLNKSYLWENINDSLYPRIIGSGYNSSNYTGFYASRYIVDLNQDSYEDMLYTVSLSTTNRHGYHTNQNGVSILSQSIINSPMNLVHVGDVDNDGIDELFYYLGSGVNNKIFMYRIVNSVPVLASTVIDFNETSVNSVNIRLSDIDLDGDNDVVFIYGNSSTPKIRIVKNDGLDIFTPGQVLQDVSFGRLIDVIDVTGDLYPDIIVHNNGYYLKMVENVSGNFNSINTIYNSSPNSFSNTNGVGLDLNNDFLKDIVIQDNNKRWVFHNMNSSLSLISYEDNNFNFGKIKRLSDIDHDGDEDILCKDTWFENLGVQYYTGEGFVYYDVDSNGVYDSIIDYPFPNFPIDYFYGSSTSYSDFSGNFLTNFGSSPGNYSLVVGNNVTNNFTSTTTPYPFVSTVDSINPISNIEIGVKNNNGIVDGKLDITISGHKCDETGRVYFQVQNYSPEIVDATVNFKLTQNSSFLFSNYSSTQSNDTIAWQVNNIEPFQIINFYADIIMPSVSNMGDTMKFYTNVSLNGGNGSVTLNDSIFEILTCAYDPNDKRITLTEDVYMGDSIFVFTDSIEYTIRFQNTGNDTATNVTIIDYLNSNFDLSSIHPVSSSHSYKFLIDSLGKVTVNFENINLVDSSTHFLNSMGYIKFRLNYKTDSPHFIPINNQALIFFDANPPIYTNYNRIFRVDCSSFMNLVYQDSMCYDTLFYVENQFLNFPFDYSWSLGAYTSDSVLRNTFPIDTVGLVNFDIQMSNDFCLIDSSFSLNIFSFPELLTNLGDTSICPNNSITITSNLSANWYVDDYFIDSTQFFYSIIDSSGIISAIIINEFGCSDTVSIHVDILSYTISVSDTICFGSDYVFADGYTSYDIQNNMSYTSYLSTEYACDSLVTTNLYVITDIPHVISQQDNILEVDYVGGQIQWYDCLLHQNINNETSNTFEAPQNGSYAVILISNGGCSDTSECYVVNTISLIENEIESIKLYPIPVISFLSIELPLKEEIVEFKISDMKGEVVLKGMFYDKKKIDIDLTNLSDGFYMIDIITTNYIKRSKIEKMN